MAAPFSDFKSTVEATIRALEQIHYIQTKEVKWTGDTIVDLELVDDDGDEWYVGNYADSGLRLEWLGECETKNREGKTETRYLVRANGLIIEAMPKHIAGWAVGYDS